MFKNKEICLIIAVTSLLQLIYVTDPVSCQPNPRRNPDGGRRRHGDDVEPTYPAWKQTYLVKYNTSASSVTNPCGEYYASEFLKNFFTLQHHFSNSCGRRPPPRPTQVHIYVVARVVLIQGQVQLNTYLNTTSSHSSWREAKRDITTCAQFIEDELAYLPDLTDTSWLGEAEIHTIPATEDCSEAVLDGQGFTLLVGEWVCAEGYYLTLDPERCHYNGSTGGGEETTSASPVEPPPDASTQPPQCTNAESCVETLREQLKQSTFCPVMNSLSVCIEMYAQSEAEKAVCYRTFEDLRLEHESATNTSCDDFTTPPDHKSTTSSQKNHETTSTTTDATDPITTTSATQFQELKYNNVSHFWNIQVKDIANSEADLKPIDAVLDEAQISSFLTLVEGGPNGIIRVNTTANAACAGYANCIIYLKLSFTDGPQPSCRTAPKRSIPQIVVAEHDWAHDGDMCTIQMTADRLNEIYDIPIRAKLDMKYDNQQLRWLNMALVRTVNKDTPGSKSREEIHLEVPIYVEDRDQKATCSSINDPHVTTFDGLQYNNYYEGEFLLYKHKNLPFRVDVMYQKCGTNVAASCNCGVAVQSGDDVFVLERCFRVRSDPISFPGQSDPPDDITEMTATFYLNNDLTPGTKLYQQAEGMKYFIYLPLGTYVKVQVSGKLVNVWIVASPNDLERTEGLCGVYNSNPSDDTTLRDETTYQDENLVGGNRGQPDRWIQDWRVPVSSTDSIFKGTAASQVPYEPKKYCECQQGETPVCGYGVDISTCDIYQGTDVTEEFIAMARPSQVSQGSESGNRKKRQSNENNVINAQDDPIRLDESWQPPKTHAWQDPWNEVNAKNWCEDYLYKNYTIGQLCDAFPNVDIQQEIKTCMEDIQITGTKSWAPSAKSALNEQCLEEIQRNNSIPDDVANQIEGSICVNSCSGKGECVNGKCRCQIGWTSPDCSVSEGQTPYISTIPGYGFCDVQFMDCSNVVVYGQNFVSGPNLTCYLQEWDINSPVGQSQGRTIKEKGIFVTFNAVECPIKKRRSYLVYISNNGQTTMVSNPLPFIPYDSRCMGCNTSSVTNTASCNLKADVSGCLIESWCYLEDEQSPDDECNVCKPDESKTGWTLSIECTFDKEHLPDWLVAVIAAVAGSIVGILFGFLLYWCCCKRKSFADSDDFDQIPAEENNLPFHPVDQRYHRTPLPFTHSDRLHEIGFRQPDYERTHFHNDGRGVENGVNDQTYF